MGHHSRGAYVALVGRIVGDGRSGVLEIRSGNRFRRVFFVAGAPVWFESDRPQDQLDEEALEDTDQRLRLLKRGLGIPLQWRRGGWTFEPREALPAEVLQKMAFLDCAPLAPLWTGVQSALRADELLEAVTDPEAGLIQPLPGLAERFALLEISGPLADLPGALEGPRSLNELMIAHSAEYEDLLKLLWAMEAMGWVRRDGDRASALGFVAPEDDPFGVSHPSLDPAEPMTAPLPKEDAQRLDPEEDEIEAVSAEDQPTLIAQRPEDRPVVGRFVHAPQASHREDLSVRDPDKTRTDAAGTPPLQRRAEDRRRPASTANRPAPTSISADAVERDYTTRMGTDYYTFLGVPAKAGAPVINRAWTRLLKRWTVASKNQELPLEVRQQARELAQVAHLAGRMFSEPDRRLEYDRRLERGQAPRAGGMKAARGLARTSPKTPTPNRPPSGDPLLEARRLLDSGDYTRATALLKHIRLQRPSDPAVLADLGWAVWKASAETEREQAEEYLQLATTFESRNFRAREFLARIALDAGDATEARSRLEVLLQLSPDSDFARRALDALPPPEEQGQSAAIRLKNLWGR